MPTIEFLSQNFCRIESNEEFRYLVKSAFVYIVFVDSSHTRFPDYQYGEGEYQKIFFRKINSNSLESLKPLMEKLQPGDMFLFDDVIAESVSGETFLVEQRVFKLY